VREAESFSETLPLLPAEAASAFLRYALKAFDSAFFFMPAAVLAAFSDARTFRFDAADCRPPPYVMRRRCLRACPFLPSARLWLGFSPGQPEASLRHTLSAMPCLLTRLAGSAEPAIDEEHALHR